MISRQKLKYIKSLQLKKYQKQEQKFLVEGEKSVLELLRSRYKINILLTTKRYLDLYPHEIAEISAEIIEVTESELKRAGVLKTNNTALAVAEIPDLGPIDFSKISFLPVFDGLQDPGNLGTIIRTCDWYGIDTIVLSKDSVDQYNPKVIQATMGSFTRVGVHYVNLGEFLSRIEIPVFGTKMKGESIYHVSWPDKVAILFGNESKGIHEHFVPYLDQILSIPKFGGAESLNVGVATAVVLDNIRRQKREDQLKK
jgi:TrmH family RNA methyltransferase